ncbi:OrdA protein [Favolaschia claudopus]|uniref:OrdA protein n=1 Tax=Favolaschia claudopus TaxID=2862362 RepID=A0AAV9ZWX2_9AGAR
MQSTTIALSLGALSFILLRTIFRALLNVLDMPSTMEWLKFADWGAKWGDICSVSLFGQPIVILNSATIIEDLNENTAAFSTRPRLPMAGELVGYDQTLVLIPYGPRFRTYRKYFANQIGSLGGVQQVIVMETEIHRFLKRLLLNPGADAISNHLRKLTGAIILRITYGIEVQEENDPFENAFLVDVFPDMLRIPEILAPFKQTARIWARETKDMVEAPYHFVRQQMTSGTAPISFVSSLLKEEEKLSEEDLRDIKFTAASFYGGKLNFTGAAEAHGNNRRADTSAAAMQAFFLAMVLAPEVQREAQTEIDSVVGTTRLPLFSDREQLPYVSAVVTELLRWHSVAPLGVPHAAMEDTVINGHFIPEGSVIIANLWNILNDPETYPKPDKFDPTRYLRPFPQRDPRTVCFGFFSLFCTVASILATFDISRAPGPLPVHENTQGTISHPKPFDCVVKPRSDHAVTLI